MFLSVGKLGDATIAYGAYCPAGKAADAGVPLASRRPVRRSSRVLFLPPLDSLRFFEAAARHQGFARAAEGARRHPGRRRPPRRDAGEASRRAGVRPPPSRRAAQRPRPGLPQGGAAHPRRGPRRLGAPAPLAAPRPHRLGRGGRREVARAPPRRFQVGAPRRRHRAGDQPPRRRPRPPRLRRLVRLHRRDRRAAPADVPRGHVARGRRSTRRTCCRSAARPCSPRSAGPLARPAWTAGPCSTTWDGTPTGRTGSPARASRRRICRGPRASASTAC